MPFIWPLALYLPRDYHDEAYLYKKIALKPQNFLIASSNEQFFIKVYTILYIPKMRRTRRSIVMFKYNLAWRFLERWKQLDLRFYGLFFLLGVLV